MCLMISDMLHTVSVSMPDSSHVFLQVHPNFWQWHRRVLYTVNIWKQRTAGTHLSPHDIVLPCTAAVMEVIRPARQPKAQADRLDSVVTAWVMYGSEDLQCGLAVP